MRIAFRRAWVIVAYTACAGPIFVAFLQRPGNPDNLEGRRLTVMLDGTGERPFVFRTLLPSTVRLIRATLPDSAKRALADFASTCAPLARLFATTPAAEHRDPVTYLIAYGLEWCCLVAFALALRAAARHFYPRGTALVDLLPIAALLALPVFFRYTSFDYDFPQLFLFTLTMLMLARRRWTWFYPLLVLCGFNKETSLLLVVIHVLGHAVTMPRRQLLLHAAVQVALLLGIRLFLQFVLFADNPGRPVEVWIVRNWERVTDPARWRFVFWHFLPVGRSSIRIPAASNVLYLALIPLLFWRWSRKPIFLRRAFWIAPLLGILIFCCGYVDELRAAYEAYPIVLLLLSGSFVRKSTEPPLLAIAGPTQTG